MGNSFIILGFIEEVIAEEDVAKKETIISSIGGGYTITDPSRSNIYIGFVGFLLPLFSGILAVPLPVCRSRPLSQLVTQSSFYHLIYHLLGFFPTSHINIRRSYLNLAIADLN